MCSHPSDFSGTFSFLHVERTELPLHPSPILTFLGWFQNQIQEEFNLVEGFGDTKMSSH